MLSLQRRYTIILGFTWDSQSRCGFARHGIPSVYVVLVCQLVIRWRSLKLPLKILVIRIRWLLELTFWTLQTQFLDFLTRTHGSNWIFNGSVYVFVHRLCVIIQIWLDFISSANRVSSLDWRMIRLTDALCLLMLFFLLNWNIERALLVQVECRLGGDVHRQSLVREVWIAYKAQKLALIEVFGAVFMRLRHHSVARAFVNIEAAARARRSLCVDIDWRVYCKLSTGAVHRPIAEVSTIRKRGLRSDWHHQAGLGRLLGAEIQGRVCRYLSIHSEVRRGGSWLLNFTILIAARRDQASLIALIRIV